MRAIRIALPAAIAFAMAGCALAPPPNGEELQKDSAPNRPIAATWTAQGGTAGPAADKWLATFNDPQLEALAAEALAYNPDLQIAAARIEQASGYQRIAASTLWPQVNAVARGGGKMGGDPSGLEGVGLFANWEIDLWGRIRSGRKAADYQYDSSVLDAEYARQSIVAQVAKGWFLATEARLQRGIAEDSVKAADSVVTLTSDRVRVGASDEYELTIARASLYSLRDAAQSLDQAYQQAVRSLEILVGRYPAAILAVPAELPAPPPPVPVGMPSELLERRPDVIAAERRVAAAFYRTQEAKAARMPRISLTASVTSLSSELFFLKNQGETVSSFGGSITAPLFLGGQLQAQVDVRTAEQRQAIAEYGRVSTRAFGEVENALSSGFSLDARESYLRQAVAENQRSLDLSGIRYRIGSGDLRAVLQQNISLYSAQVNLVRVRSERLVQRVNLHVALGGSFDEYPTNPPPPPPQSDQPAEPEVTITPVPDVPH
jgi:multidrug efflux system outer membrane protein